MLQPLHKSLIKPCHKYRRKRGILTHRVSPFLEIPNSHYTVKLFLTLFMKTPSDKHTITQLLQNPKVAELTAPNPQLTPANTLNAKDPLQYYPQIYTLNYQSSLSPSDFFTYL
jgi:hypothetical protein